MEDTQPTEPTASSQGERIAFLVDVDNTLLDNDAAKEEIDRKMRLVLGDTETERFWEAYETVRRETGRVAVPQALVEYLRDLPPETDPAAALDRHIALADALIGVPYANYVYPGALDSLARLRELGRVAILTEGDPAFQATKVARAQLADAVEGYVFVCPDKSAYLREVAAIFPADRLVLVEDKANNITRARRIFAGLGVPFSGIFVRQGKYAAATGPDWRGAELIVESVGELAAMAPDAIAAALRTPIDPTDA